MSTTLLSALLSELLIYKYAVLVGAIFASGIVPLPIDELLLATGAFASQGYMSLALSLAVATAANVIGDCVVYLLARRYGPPVLRFFKVERSPRVERVKAYINDRAGITIFVTRFVGGLDIAASILAGLAKVSLIFFLTFDLFGNLADIALLLFIGYFFGSYWQTLSDTIGLIGWLVLLIVLGGFAVSYYRYSHRK